MVTRGPIHIIALTAETKPERDENRHDVAPGFSKDVQAGDQTDLLFSDHLGGRRRAQKSGVDPEIERDDEQCAKTK